MLREDSPTGPEPKPSGFVSKVRNLWDVRNSASPAPYSLSFAMPRRSLQSVAAHRSGAQRGSGEDRWWSLTDPVEDRCFGDRFHVVLW